MPRLITIGIPSWCESERIVPVVRAVDELLTRSFPDDERVIVNADNCSPDGTAATFLATHTTNPKVSLLTEPGLRGKGYNFQLLFSYALERRADVLITLDADLEVIADDWLPEISRPILSAEADMCVPLYPRFWYDGNLTNQVVAPLVLAVTHVPIRQPIAGDFAFAPSALAHLLALDWPLKARRFGVDSFAVLRILKAGLRITQVPLSTGKIHSWRSDTADEVEDEMADKFEEIAGTALEELSNWEVVQRGTAIPRFPAAPQLGQAPKAYDVAHIIETARRGFAQQHDRELFRLLAGSTPVPEGALMRIDESHWASILANCLLFARTNRLTTDFFAAFKALFFLRLASVLPELDDENVEPMVQRVAELLNARLVDRSELKTLPAGQERHR